MIKSMTQSSRVENEKEEGAEDGASFGEVEKNPAEKASRKRKENHEPSDEVEQSSVSSNTKKKKSKTSSRVNDSEGDSSCIHPRSTRILRPKPNDILLGRGKPIQDHSGNIRLRKLVDFHRARYLKARREVKSIIAEEIVQSIKDVEKGDGENASRFLRRFEEEYWIEVSDDIARDKVSHALRSKTRKSDVLPSADSRQHSHAFDLVDGNPLAVHRVLPSPASSLFQVLPTNALLEEAANLQQVAAASLSRHPLGYPSIPSIPACVAPPFPSPFLNPSLNLMAAASRRMVDPNLAAALGIYRGGGAGVLPAGHPVIAGAGAGASSSRLYYLNGLEPPSIMPPVTTPLSNYRITEAALLGAQAAQQQPRLDMSRQPQKSRPNKYYF
jgi:hypothetical protein